ncbi:MAG TPA: CGNR zinc finger domain-containing protein [Stellaceae bacterium]|nr:CGNR zinc finger domain-containing protein [Stellaceae bacterium]
MAVASPMNAIAAEAPSRAGVLPLVGSELAFDFTNTSSGRGGPRHMDHLRTPEHLLSWARHAKLLTPRDGRYIEKRLAADAALGAALLERALALREAIYAIGIACARGRRPRPEHVDALAHVHAGCIDKARLSPCEANFAWVWRPEDGIIEAILGPIALSALTTLSQADLTRIKQCGGEHCGWLFFDTTKNKRRRWCEMEVCGNRAKQKAHRARALRARGRGR